MKSPTPGEWCTEGVFHIQPPIYGANFSTNISIPQN